MSAKVRKTLTLDPEVVEAFGDDVEGLSATVNAILTAELERRRQHAALGRLLERLDAENDNRPVDPDLVAKFRNLLS